jgi:hypothetical protein
MKLLKGRFFVPIFLIFIAGCESHYELHRTRFISGNYAGLWLTDSTYSVKFARTPQGTLGDSVTNVWSLDGSSITFYGFHNPRNLASQTVLGEVSGKPHSLTLDLLDSGKVYRFIEVLYCPPSN